MFRFLIIITLVFMTMTMSAQETTSCPMSYCTPESHPDPDDACTDTDTSFDSECTDTSFDSECTDTDTSFDSEPTDTERTDTPRTMLYNTLSEPYNKIISSVPQWEISESYVKNTFTVVEPADPLLLVSTDTTNISLLDVDDFVIDLTQPNTDIKWSINETHQVPNAKDCRSVSCSYTALGETISDIIAVEASISTKYIIVPTSKQEISLPIFTLTLTRHGWDATVKQVPLEKAYSRIVNEKSKTMLREAGVPPSDWEDTAVIAPPLTYAVWHVIKGLDELKACGNMFWIPVTYAGE